MPGARVRALCAAYPETWVDLPDVEWDRIEQVIDDAWRQVAPRRLVSTLEPS
jgi:hypothetical protein